MKVTLHSPVEGKQPGETVDVPDGRGQWLVQNGYAVTDDQPEDFGRTATTVDADKDPTLAQNREAPGEELKDPEPAKPKRAPAKKSDSVPEEPAPEA